MNEANRRSARRATGLALYFAGAGLSLVLTGCVGYVEGDGGGVVVAEPEPEFVWFGGYVDGPRGRDYGYRGAESRGFYHGGRR